MNLFLGVGLNLTDLKTLFLISRFLLTVLQETGLQAINILISCL